MPGSGPRRVKRKPPEREQQSNQMPGARTTAAAPVKRRRAAADQRDEQQITNSKRIVRMERSGSERNPKCQIRWSVAAGAITRDADRLVKLIASIWNGWKPLGVDRLPGPPVGVTRAAVDAASRAFDAALTDITSQGTIPHKPDYVALEQCKARYQVPDSIGALPGVEVGDVIDYRAKASLMGLHRRLRDGISTMRTPAGVSVANSLAYKERSGYDDENKIIRSGERRILYQGTSGNVTVASNQNRPRGARVCSALDKASNIALIRSFLWSVSELVMDEGSTRSDLIVRQAGYSDEEVLELRVLDSDGSKSYTFQGMFKVTGFKYTRKAAESSDGTPGNDELYFNLHPASGPHLLA